MELQDLRVIARDSAGTGPSRRTRAAGMIPGVIYGGGEQPVSVSVDERTFVQLIHGRFGDHAVLKLDVAERPELTTTCVLKQLQHDLVRGNVIHIDFLRISLEDRIHTTVAIEFVGQAKGVLDGGVLDQIAREVEVECRALDTPEKITIDVSELEVGDTMTVASLVAPENVTIITDPESPIASVHAPRVIEESAAVEGEEGAKEPEVIGGAKTAES
jgi:large subunit ribosomal protein L25